MDWLHPLFVLLKGANVNRRTVKNVKLAAWQIDSVERSDP